MYRSLYATLQQHTETTNLTNAHTSNHRISQSQCIQATHALMSSIQMGLVCIAGALLHGNAPDPCSRLLYEAVHLLASRISPRLGVQSRVNICSCQMLSVLGGFSATAALFAEYQSAGSRTLQGDDSCAFVAAIHALQRKVLPRKRYLCMRSSLQGWILWRQQLAGIAKDFGPLSSSFSSGLKRRKSKSLLIILE